MVECKRPIGGRLSYAQADCLDSLWRAGAIVIIARSLDDVINALQAGKTPVETQAEIARILQKGPEPPARKRLR